MARTQTKMIEIMKFDVNTTQADIDNGECRLANRCMEKVAIGRALGVETKGDASHVRVDAGSIKFNHRGYRWSAPTPKIAKAALIKFDNPKTCHLVKPHKYSVVATRGAKIRPTSPERQKQINEARTERAKAGTPDKQYNRHTLRQRIVGFA